MCFKMCLISHIVIHNTSFHQYQRPKTLTRETRLKLQEQLKNVRNNHRESEGHLNVTPIAHLSKLTKNTNLTKPTIDPNQNDNTTTQITQGKNIQ